MPPPLCPSHLPPQHSPVFERRLRHVHLHLLPLLLKSQSREGGGGEGGGEGPEGVERGKGTGALEEELGPLQTPLQARDLLLYYTLNRQ
jgi:hypothetical protein